MPVSIAISENPPRVQLEERPVLQARRHAIERAQPRGTAISRSMRSSVVLDRLRSAFDARVDRGARRIGMHQVGGKAVERVEPVVVAGDREIGFSTPFSGK